MKRKILTLIVAISLFSCFVSLKSSIAYGNGKSIEYQIKLLENEVFKKAHDLSLSPYEKPSINLPDSVDNLTYDQWRDIRFKPEKSLWKGNDSLFELRFYHLGFLYKTPVKVNLVTSEGVEEFSFDASLFDYGKNDFPPDLLRDLGFAGFMM